MIPAKVLDYLKTPRVNEEYAEFCRTVAASLPDGDQVRDVLEAAADRIDNISETEKQCAEEMADYLRQRESARRAGTVMANYGQMENTI